MYSLLKKLGLAVLLLASSFVLGQTPKVFPPEDTGLDASKPGSCLAPYFYQATDTHLLYFCDAGTNALVSLGSGGGGSGNVSTAPTNAQNIVQNVNGGITTQFSATNIGQMRLVTTAWNWNQSPTSPSSLSAGSNTISLAPCPAGIDVNSSTEHYTYAVYIAGTGTPEAVPVTGGTCTPGAASGTITVTNANSHAAGYTVASASTGIQEAWNDGWTADGGEQNWPYVKLMANTIYNVYSTVYLRGRGGTLDGTAAAILCSTRDKCIYSGTTQAEPFVHGHHIYGIMGGSTLNVDGVQVSNVSAASGTYTITTATTHPFVSGDYVDCEYYTSTAGLNQHWTSKVLSAGLTSNQFEVQFGSQTASPGTYVFGFCNIENAFIEDNSDHDAYVDITITQSFTGSTGFFSYGIVNDNDQQLQISRFSNRSSSVLKSSANFPTGAMVYGRFDQGNSGITIVKDSEFTNENCIIASGNGAIFSDSVCQGFQVYGIRYFGGLQTFTASNIYQESTGGTNNPLYSPSIASQMGYLLQGGQGNNRIVGDFPIGGLYPNFSNGGGTKRYYWIVGHCSATGYTLPTPIGYAQPVNSSTNITVQWPAFQPNCASTYTFDLLEITAFCSLGSGNCQAPFGTGNFAVSTAIPISACGSNGMCSFTDTQAANTSYTVQAFGWGPGYWFWPSNIAVNNTTVVEDITFSNPAVVASNQSGVTAIIAQECFQGGDSQLIMGITVSCLSTGPSAGQGFLATLLTQVDGSGNGVPYYAKGRVNFTGKTGSTFYDIITLQDSNSAKTTSTQGMRPPADAGDMAIGWDQIGGLSWRANTSISSYIGVLPSGSNWLERITSTGHTIQTNAYICGPRPWLDVVCQGADFTGSADSTAAFNNAIALCAATGQSVFIPAGSYKVQTLTINTPCTFTTDAIFPAHLIRNSATTTSNFQTGWIVVSNSNVTLDGIEFDGNASSFNGNCIVVLGTISDIIIRNNWIHNCEGSGIHVLGTSASSVGPSRVDISGNKIQAGSDANAQGAIFGQSTLNVIHIHDNPQIDGTLLAAGSTINFLSAGLTTVFNGIDISNNPQILCPATGSSWCVQMGGFNAYEVIAPRVENNSFELTGTNAGFVSIPIAISGKLINGNHMNTHFIDLGRCGATISSACSNDGVSNSTSTWTSATGTFTSADTGKTLRYACSGTNYTTLVTFSNSTTLTLTTAAVCTGSSEAWYLYGYSATGYGIEGGGSTGTIITNNTLYDEGSQGGTCIGLDGSSYTIIEGNECQGIPENSGQGIGMIAGTAPQQIASLAESLNTVTVSTSGALNASWQPATTIAFSNCQLNTCRSGTDGSISGAPTTTFTSATAAFTSADVNRFINIYGCAASGYSLNSIASVTNGTTVTLAFSCSTNGSSLTWQIVTSPQLFTATAINTNYSRSGGTFSFIDMTTGVTCSSNCGGMIQTVSFNTVKGNLVQLPQALPTSGNVFAYVIKTQSTNPQYAYADTFEGNKAIEASGGTGAQDCFVQTGNGTPLIDSSEWKNNTCINANNGIVINNGQNIKLRDNEMINVSTPWGGSLQIGEIADQVDTVSTSQLGGTGFGTGPAVVGAATTKSIRVTVGTSPAASTATITGLSPAALTGWNCTPLNDQNSSTAANRQTGSTTTSVTWTFSSAASASDVLNASCSSF